jgi:photosynthetic reaction center H subunit
MLFRYLQVTLKSNGREVLVPMNFLRIRGAGYVEVYALNASQFADVPGTKSPDVVTMLEEEKIQAYFGAGLLYADEERAEPLI